MKRVVASSHVHAQTKTSLRYEATWQVEGPLLTWKATVSLRGRRWCLAGGMPQWGGGSEAEAVRKDIGRSIDGLVLREVAGSTRAVVPVRGIGPRRR